MSADTEEHLTSSNPLLDKKKKTTMNTKELPQSDKGHLSKSNG